jgi:hypothetical protein
MGLWLAAAALVAIGAVGIPLAALAGKRAGRRLRGNLQLAAIFLGLGEVLDPPSKHRIEAGERDEKESPAPGEPVKPGG